MLFFHEHKEGCTPLKPCRNCQTFADFRNCLGPSKFQELCALAELKREMILSATPVPIETLLVSLDGFRQLGMHADYALKNNEIQTIEDLVRVSVPEFFRMPHMGFTSIKSISIALAQSGHSIGELSTCYI